MSFSKRPCIMVLDGHTLNPGDLSWTRLQSLGRLSVYDYSSPEEIRARAVEANILLVNKAALDAPTLEQLPELKAICVTATGYNNVDVEAARRRRIPVCNVVGYGTDAVAQHVFALLLEMSNQVGAHHQSVVRGDWSAQPHFSYQLRPLMELAGKTMGIYGFGSIGRRVAEIARAFGMQVLATTRSPEKVGEDWVRLVDVAELFAASDVVSLHAPLTAENAGLVNAGLLAAMKPSALLINTARGGLVRETDLREALLQGRLGGAALDVLDQEPPAAGHPLFGLENCLLTPHLAWATREARERLLEESIRNVAAFIQGEPRNVVNPWE